MVLGDEINRVFLPRKIYGFIFVYHPLFQPWATIFAIFPTTKKNANHFICYSFHLLILCMSLRVHFVHWPSESSEVSLPKGRYFVFVFAAAAIPFFFSMTMWQHPSDVTFPGKWFNLPRYDRFVWTQQCSDVVGICSRRRPRNGLFPAIWKSVLIYFAGSRTSSAACNQTCLPFTCWNPLGNFVFLRWTKRCWWCCLDGSSVPLLVHRQTFSNTLWNFKANFLRTEFSTTMFC